MALRWAFTVRSCTSSRSAICLFNRPSATKVRTRNCCGDRLASLEAKAQENGQAIGIVSALPISIGAVTDWARGLEGKGFVLLPASALMK